MRFPNQPLPEDLRLPKERAEELLQIIHRDRRHLDRCDDYLHGRHDDPYMPKDATAEYRLLAERCKTNYMDLVVTSVAQQMYVDSFRAGDANKEHETSAWQHWQRSHLDARQHPLYRSVLTYGHAFTVTEMDAKNKPRTRTLSPFLTAAMYEDPANDLDPQCALTKAKLPRAVTHDDGRTVEIPGTAYLWDETFKYELTYLDDCTVKDIRPVGTHGSTVCPVTRFTYNIDLEGRTEGIVFPLIPLQDRINESVFDLLVVQKGGAFKVRTIAGLVPQVMQKPVWEVDEDGNPVLDDQGNKILDHLEEMHDPITGQPIVAPININASRFMVADDPDTKFGQLDETPLDGYIASIEMSIRHLSSVTQMPPDYMLGQVANLSAEALTAAERALSRKIAEFQSSVGESWERCFRIASELSGDTKAADDEAAEVVWRDQDKASMSRVADALGKLGEQVHVPDEGLWEMIPGVTQAQLERWQDLKEQEPDAQMASALQRVTQPRTDTSQQSAPPYSTAGATAGGREWHQHQQKLVS